MSDRAQPDLQSTVNTQATEAAARQPQALKRSLSLDLNGLPPRLTDVIAANLLTYTEIDAVKHTAIVPAEPVVPAITDVWCITLYPEAN